MLNLGYDVISKSFGTIFEETLPLNAIVLSTIELYEACLSTLTVKELKNLQNIFNRTSTLIWMTGGGLFEAKRPDFATAFGCLRSIALEQPSLKPFLLDIDPTLQELHAAKNNVSILLDHALRGVNKQDSEFYQYNGILHVSRFYPEKALNAKFHSAQLKIPKLTSLNDAGYCSLSITVPGQFDTLQFIAADNNFPPLRSDHILIRASCYSINAKVSLKYFPNI